MLLQWILSPCFLISVVLTVRAMLGRRISARFRYALWGVVLVRLLIPVQLFILPTDGDSPAMIRSMADRMEERSDSVLPVLSVLEEAAQAETDGTLFDVRSAADFPVETGRERAARYTQVSQAYQVPAHLSVLMIAQLLGLL